MRVEEDKKKYLTEKYTLLNEECVIIPEFISHCIINKVFYTHRVINHGNKPGIEIKGSTEKIKKERNKINKIIREAKRIYTISNKLHNILHNK
ncbi:hypothetical protein NEPAR06_2439 [Nematocida parisii]|uniref:Uncharacterized protein n=1 Tax=Nematocida parisii (strain ERTm3) TaxID=935791 RepID=I3EJS4_NEMP3|nr:uncharacterized protein NEPG_01001 [Nematocida parisii ERTm1]EIJ89471.1 hypothetical protein NEQG_00241 [Nematocida parisii ERTm3]KAI5145561.1 hypothetical protein NEPAR04_2478 [Nematocida parisii]EIJ94333.1 hypothetical protein NEPG_01001 [Nematocida parisii ERTm1]KAI5146446.1 hypothetical protein NEPAR07_2382 [Nematocida parisii]KAI5157344.1 hypothetical protein NEPAR06_2439 [Nematocida parisii]|eukprot:XP_013058829.1 hypothetical protein NEPG_01001 [Nematocida parisii ERTm1]